jgi:hypothetical protein
MRRVRGVASGFGSVALGGVWVPRLFVLEVGVLLGWEGGLFGLPRRFGGEEAGGGVVSPGLRR